MSAFLPQHDPNRADRADELKTSQKSYQFNHTYVSPLALVERVPIHDEFSFHWLTSVAKHVVTSIANRAEVEVGEHHRGYHQSKHGFLRHMLSTAETITHGIKHIVSDALKFEGRIGAHSTRPESLEDYAKLFRAIGLPPVAEDYTDDRAFGCMRLAGPNPEMIARMKLRDPRFPVTDADFEVAVPDDAFDAALAEGRVFLADYAALDGAEHGDYPHGQKYIYAPLAMFVVEKTTGHLLPVAIQCKQKSVSDNPIFTPADGYNWLIAKTIVEVADSNFHEAFAHLGRTHLFMEPFAVATIRQLASLHPLRLLLMPHFEGTLAINEAAWKHLISNKGAVDKLFGGSINTSRKLTILGVQSARANGLQLPKTFAHRGVDDLSSLPNYPYRDDALLHWEAIRAWVSDYLSLYYQNATDLLEDDELILWALELASQDGGRVNGMPNDGKFHAVEELIDVIALIIFTCSVQHAAVNFPQYDLMTYVPRMPLAAYQPAPTTKTGATEADYLAMLPPMDMAELQVELGYLLGSVRYTQLGQYREGHFRDPRVAAPLAAFQERLATIGKTIEHRNTIRKPYNFLLPSGVPQSINI